MSKLILLDLGNVLLDFDFGIFVLKVASKYSVAEDIVIRTFVQGNAKADYDRGRVSEDQFFQSMALALSCPNSEVPYLKQAWQDIFWPTSGAIESLKRVRNSYSVAVLSDTDPVHHRHFIKKYPFIAQISKFYASYQLGMCKRDPGAFANILKIIGREPHEVYFVDDLEVNVNAAAEMGINAFMFRSWETLLPQLLNGQHG